MAEPELSRWQLLKDISIFQVKLALDATRDLLLSPVSITSAVIDLIKGSQYSQSYFYKVMKLGRKTDHWINLFGAGGHRDEPAVQQAAQEDVEPGLQQSAEPGANLDELFSRVETLLKEQHDKGGLTATAKASIDRYLDKIVSSQEQKLTSELENK
ncbi:hypothetical protein SG34_003500 [Thalassomonas viridans]|uniref:Uncharacterized protein n=1 Tax=Thalassomonas viridans TaxID=137584 RepID=A0AAE9Z678_9GAMM|nr:hypothetical protein [Thalassomonas viridans]WDE06008.1 hypothetical protein SG34_003500 [Thalassomonas viridans]